MPPSRLTQAYHTHTHIRAHARTHARNVAHNGIGTPYCADRPGLLKVAQMASSQSESPATAAARKNSMLGRLSIDAPEHLDETPSSSGRERAGSAIDASFNAAASEEGDMATGFDNLDEIIENWSDEDE